ncbi:TolC family protein, partial [bacterium]|nr:TolC family protein [bacterium]
YKTKIGQAWANYFPKVGVGIGYTRNKYLPMFFTPSVSKYNSYTMPSIDAEWMIFDFGKTKAQADVASKTHQATEEDLQETVNTTIYNVKNAFYTLLYTIQQEKVWQSSVEQYEISLEQAKAYYDIGTKPKIDVYTAEYNLSNAKLGHIKAQNDIQLAYADLNNAMGMPEYANYELSEELTLKKYNVKMSDLLNEALEVRPGLLAAKKKAEASKHLVTASKRAFLPDLKLSASFTQGGLTANSGEYGYAFGGNLAYPLTNIALLKKQVDEAHATADKDVADYEVTRQKVYLDVKQAYIQLKNAKENVPVAQKALEQAKEQFNLARGRYKVGLGDVIELKDAETTYRNAQLAYYKALLDYNISAANLERVVGVPIVAEEEVAL